MAETKTTLEDDFRDSLKDFVLVMDKVANHYTTIEDLKTSFQLAIENDVHRDLLWSVIKSKK